MFRRFSGLFAAALLGVLSLVLLQPAAASSLAQPPRPTLTPTPLPTETPLPTATRAPVTTVPGATAEPTAIAPTVEATATVAPTATALPTATPIPATATPVPPVTLPDTGVVKPVPVALPVTSAPQSSNTWLWLGVSLVVLGLAGRVGLKFMR